MGLSIAIVGLPNVGKSTLFNALVKTRQAEASNYAFCTIDPNVGIVDVPDQRLNRLYDLVVSNMRQVTSNKANSKLEILNPKQIPNPPLRQGFAGQADDQNSKLNSHSERSEESRDPSASPQDNRRLPKIVPATVEFIDIAGLVKEAHKGEGLGNKFLAHIRECDAICMVLRCFEDSDIMHVAGRIDPKDDMETIITELELADLQTLEKSELKSQKSKVKTESQNLKLLKDKLRIYALNVSEKDAGLSVEEVAKKFNLDPTIVNRQSSIVISAKIEEDLIDLSPDEQKEYLQSLGLQKSGLDRLIQSAYDTLGLQSFFTAGPKEVRAWTIKKGTKAPEAAGKIHTDFQRGFIKAEVISYDDYVEFHGESKARAAGKLRLEGKDYVVKDGDIIEFKFNV